MVHNRYQHAGGEDTVFANESLLLRKAGHNVIEHITNNDVISSSLDKIKASLGATWSYSGYRALRDLLDQEKPDVVHVHNFFPFPSASIFWACAHRKIPAVWTLHNFRLMCANGLLYRKDRPCTDCVGRNPLPAVWHKCYRQSRLGSTVVAATIAAHRILGTWPTRVTKFIALTEFAKAQFIKAGLPAERIVVKPNFGDATPPTNLPRAGVLYVGRLSPEKGVETLVRAWTRMPETLTIVGDGPLRNHLAKIAGPNVRFAGKMVQADVIKEMSQTRLLVVPSLWYENFPMTVVEGMAAATPILASRIGALSTIIEDGITGLHFNAGDIDDLTRIATAALSDDKRLREIGARARLNFEAKLTPRQSLQALERLYFDMIEGGA